MNPENNESIENHDVFLDSTDRNYQNSINNFSTHHTQPDGKGTTQPTSNTQGVTSVTSSPNKGGSYTVSSGSGDASSAKYLLEFLEKLVAGADKVDDLSLAAKDANDLNTKFFEANTSLSDGWYSVADFCNRIDVYVQESLKGLYVHVKEFCESTMANEAGAAQAAEKANNDAQRILDKYN